jgi:hypothetical protein
MQFSHRITLSTSVARRSAAGLPQEEQGSIFSCAVILILVVSARTWTIAKVARAASSLCCAGYHPHYSNLAYSLPETS